MPAEIDREINGVHLYLLPNAALHQFCIGLYIRAGSLYESSAENGLTHLFEHTVFRSIKQKYGGRLYELLSENGIWFEGSTYREYLSFTVSGLQKGVRLGTDILLSVFDALSVDREGFNAEKRRVLSEIREDDERHRLGWFADCFVWNGTPMAQTISGAAAHVSRFSFPQVRDWQKRLLTKDNLFFCGTGNLTDADVAYLSNGIAGLPVGETTELRDNTVPVPADFGRRQFALHVIHDNYCRIAFSFDIDNARCPLAARELLYCVLFCNDDAALYTALSEDAGLIYSYNSTLEQYRNISCLKFDFEVRREDVAAALAKTFAVLRDIKNGLFDFERNLQKELTPMITELDNAEALNESVAYYNHILGAEPLDYAKPDFGWHDGLTKEKVCACAKAIFRPENLVLTFKGDRNYLRQRKFLPLIELLEQEET